MGTGRLLRCIGTGGAALAVALLWLTKFLPWGAGDGILNGYGFAEQMGEPNELDGMIYGCFRYLSGFSSLLMVLGAGLALTAGVRSRPGRLLVGLLMLVGTILLVVLSADSVISPKGRSAASSMAGGYPSAALELSIYLLTVVAAILLLTGRWHSYGWFAVSLLVALAVLHAGSLADYVVQSDRPLRVEVLAWLPAVWYLCAAAGAALALTGSAVRAGQGRRARHATAWHDREPWTAAPANGMPTRTGR